MCDERHARLQMQLASANAMPRCGAKTRRATPCQGPAMGNGRCRMHGGTSTGPRTPEGLERSRRSTWKHGHYSAAAVQARRMARLETRELIRLMHEYALELSDG